MADPIEVVRRYVKALDARREYRGAYNLQVKGAARARAIASRDRELREAEAELRALVEEPKAV